MVQRYDGRKQGQLREIKVTFNIFDYAAGSVLFEMGRTKVLCAVSLQQSVPSFLKGKKQGWLTAEYSMLPASTLIRTVRESSLMRRNDRCTEISRFIGRSLRAIVNLSSIGENTIIVDCDVLQADGGTRTASITGASLALRVAVSKWFKDKMIINDILTDDIAAISFGFINGIPLLDLDFCEDSKADADFNLVVTKTNKLVEIQGASEGQVVSWNQFEKARIMACEGIEQIFKTTEDFLGPLVGLSERTKECIPLFSLQNRKNAFLVD